MASVDEKSGKVSAVADSHPSKTKMIMFVSLGALLLIGASIGGTLMLARGSMQVDAAETADAESSDGKSAKVEKKHGKKKKQSKPSGDSAIYLPLDPPFVVNSQDQGASRFLQVTVELMAYDAAAIEELKKHMPLIRNSLVMLFSSQMVTDLRTREGKEKLREAALEEVQRVMEEQIGSSDIESLYFTSFVIQ
jgi:flagellar protein FliL